MGAPCGLVSHDRYAAKHDPFVYFDDLNGWNGTSFAPGTRCTDHVVDYAQLDADLAAGTLPDYVFITPDLDDDMHDGSARGGRRCGSADPAARLHRHEAPTRTAARCSWSADEGEQLRRRPAVPRRLRRTRARAPSRRPPGLASSFLLTVEKILGVQALPCSATPDAVAPMSDLFTAPL